MKTKDFIFFVWFLMITAATYVSIDAFNHFKILLEYGISYWRIAGFSVIYILFVGMILMYYLAMIRNNFDDNVR